MSNPTVKARARGAAMVESICVISVFILFFVAMVYFQALYHRKLRVQELARSAAVSYAMDACQGDPLATVQKDLGSVQNNGSGSAPGAGGINTQNKAQVGSQGNAPVGAALGNQGLTGDPITAINVKGPASGTTQRSALSARTGFRASVGSNSYMSCGDQQKDGDIGSALSFVGKALGF